MEANSIDLQDIPYPEKFIAIDSETKHEYVLEFIDFIYDSEKKRPIGTYKVSISKRSGESN